MKMKMNLNLAFGLALVLVLTGFASTALAGVIDDPWQTGNFQIDLGMPAFEPGIPGDIRSDPELNDGWSPQGPDAPGEWMPYEIGDPMGNWWNQWWYDDPFDPNRRKEIDLNFRISPNLPLDGPVIGPTNFDGGLFLFPQDSFLEITVNWSSPQWSAQGVTDAPPQPGEDQFVQRADSMTFLYAFGSGGIAWEMNPGYTYDGLDRRIGTSFDPGIFDPATGELAIGIGNIGYGIDTFNPEWVSVDVRGYNVSVEGTIGHACLPKEDIPEPATVSLLGLGMLGMVVRKLRKRG